MICRAISKPVPSLVFHSQRVKGTHEATGECLAADVSVMGEETIGIWATSSRNLLVPSGPAWAQSHRYHFHLIMIAAVHILDSVAPSCMVTWWPIVKCSVSTKAQL